MTSDFQKIPKRYETFFDAQLCFRNSCPGFGHLLKPNLFETLYRILG
jgi:hypothetical protein